VADTLQSVLIGGAAGLVSAVITHFSTRAKIRLDLAAEYDKSLQEARLEKYIKLWGMMKDLPKYGRAPVTYKMIRSISDDTKQWYFDGGGIYLTKRSRDPYLKWKALLEPLLDAEHKPEDVVHDDQINLIVAAGSTLRTRLSEDIGTKRLARI
jgi:hypothetical protein